MNRPVKLAISLCSVIVMCGVVSHAQTKPSAPAATGEMVESPSYKAWANFKPGTTVVLKGVTHAGGQDIDTEATSKLIEVTDEKAVVELVSSAVVNGQTMAQPPRKMELTKMVAKSELSQGGKGFDPELLANAREESVTVPAGTFNAKVIELTKQQGGMTLKIKVWYTLEVPGGTVKTEVNGEGATAMSVSMQLASIDKK